jgi:hypothetical protein
MLQTATCTLQVQIVSLGELAHLDDETYQRFFIALETEAGLQCPRSLYSAKHAVELQSEGEVMAVFYSFHYAKDNWRVQQVRNIGVLENVDSVAAQEWESIRRNSVAAIKDWINQQMSYKRAVVVLIGSQTASREWVQYEIRRAWEFKKPLLGIRIHGLEDRDGLTSSCGENPFVKMGCWQVPVFDPAGYGSAAKYADIRRNLSTWVKQGYRRS